MICQSLPCTTEFTPRLSGGNPQIYCSVKCRKRQTYRMWCLFNWERSKAHNLASYYRHRDERMLAGRMRYLNNIEAERARNKEWQKSNRELCRERTRRHGYKRRAWKKGAKHLSLTPTQWEQIKKNYNYLCAYCHKSRTLTQDHVIPLSKGGQHIASNIVPSCRSCNSRKGNRTI